eukprot:366366-Chlamydomonas_euryale.AAC.10
MCASAMRTICMRYAPSRVSGTACSTEGQSAPLPPPVRNPSVGSCMPSEPFFPQFSAPPAPASGRGWLWHWGALLDWALWGWAVWSHRGNSSQWLAVEPAIAPLWSHGSAHVYVPCTEALKLDALSVSDSI